MVEGLSASTGVDAKRFSNAVREKLGHEDSYKEATRQANGRFRFAARQNSWTAEKLLELNAENNYFKSGTNILLHPSI